MTKTALTVSLLLAFALTTPALSAQIKAPVRTLPKNEKVVKPIDPNQAANQVRIVNTYDLPIKDNFPHSPAIARLDDGRYFVAWEEIHLAANKTVGSAMLFADTMQTAHPPVYFTEFMPELSIGRSRIIAFSDGNTLVLYEHLKDHKTRFILFDGAFDIIKGPVLINGGAGATMMSAARLAGGKLAVIGFHTLGGTLGGFGKITVVNSAGDIILPPTTFTDKGRIDDLSVAVLPNGLIVIAYALGHGRSIVLDQSGNVIRPPTVFHPNTASLITAVPLDNGNVMIVYRNQFYKPVCQVLDAQGNNVGAAVVIQDLNVEGLQAVRLNNGNVLVCFNKAENQAVSGLTLALLDRTGKTLKGPSPILEGYGTVNRLYSLLPVKTDMAFIFLGAWLRVEGKPEERKNGFFLVK